MKAVVYACNKKGDREDIERQLTVCKEKAATKDIEIIAEYVDDCREQPELARLILEPSAAEYVVVTKPGIISNHFHEYGVLSNKLNENGLHVVVAEMPEHVGLFTLARSNAPLLIDEVK